MRGGRHRVGSEKRSCRGWEAHLLWVESTVAEGGKHSCSGMESTVAEDGQQSSRGVESIVAEGGSAQL